MPFFEEKWASVFSEFLSFPCKDGYPSTEHSDVQQRIRLHHLVQAEDGDVELLLPDRPGGKLRRAPYPRVALNKAYLDVGLVGPPVQCEEADGTCELMEKEISWLKPVSGSYGADYKFQLDVGMYSLSALLEPSSLIYVTIQMEMAGHKGSESYWPLEGALNTSL